MKGLNVKKLAAVGVGAALVGAALAPVASAITLQKSDLINSNGEPVVNVVVGSQSLPSDAVWAGNVAAKIAQLATRDTPVTVTKTAGDGSSGGATEETTIVPEVTVSGLSVDLSVGGTIVTSDSDSERLDDDYYINHLRGALDSNATDSLTNTLKPTDAYLTDTDLEFLLDESFNYTFNGTSRDQTIKEKVLVLPKTLFDQDKDVKDLVMYFQDSNTIAYVVSFGDGVPIYANNDSTSTADSNFTDGDDDFFEVPFFGTTYVLLATTGSNSTPEVRLASNETAKTRMSVGEEVTSLKGKNILEGKNNLTVKLEDVFTSGGTVKGTFGLYDEDGTQVDTVDVTSGTFLEDQFRVSGDEVLQSSVFIDTLVDDTSDVDDDWARVRAGEDIVRLKSGEEYPYDPNDTSGDKDYWLVSMGTGTNTNIGRVISSIEIYNAAFKEISKWDDDNPLVAGKDGFNTDTFDESAMFLAGLPDTTAGYNLFNVSFNGFDHDEEEFTLKWGEGQYFEYKDSDKADHMVEYFFDNLNSTTPSGETFNFDVSSERYFFKMDANGEDFNIGDGNFLNGVKILQLDNNVAGSVRVRTQLTDTTVTNAAGTNITIDGVTYSLVQKGGADGNEMRLRADGYFQVADDKSINNAAASDFVKGLYSQSVFNNKFYFTDQNTTLVAGGTPKVELLGRDDEKFLFHYHYTGTGGIAADSATGEVWLLLDGNTALAPRFGSLDFNGTDVTEGVTTGLDFNYYVPHDSELGYTEPRNYNIANFTFTEPASASGNQTQTGAGIMRVYLDTDSGSTPPVEDTTDLPTTALGGTSAEVQITVDGTGSNGDGATAISLSEYQPQDRIQIGWTNFGSFVELDEDVFTAKIPERRLYVDYVVAGQNTTTEVTGGEDFEGVEEGDSIKATGGTEVTVKKINYTASVDPAEVVVTPTVTAGLTLADVIATPSPANVKAVVPVGNLVFLDKDAFGAAGSHVIIGGYKVNSLAQGLTLPSGQSLEEALTASGDRVTERLSNGDIIAAGWTADDTAAAARDLIAALDTLFN